MAEIVPGSKVTIHLSITLEDGTVAESTFDEEPMSFVVGDGTIIEGLELALYGMKAGEEDTITMTPEQTFGFHDPENVHDMLLSDFNDDLQPEENQIIAFHTPAGDEVAGMVKKVAADSVTVDFNHPLAGHDLKYRMKIIDVA